VAVPFLSLLRAALAVFFALAASAVPAQDVRLYRDTYGVPHVFAETREGAYFGAGYAMAEDLGFHASELALLAEGRKAEFLGAGARDANVQSDIEARHFHFLDDARAGFQWLSPEVKAALRAYAGGIVRRYAETADSRPDWAIDVEPEHLAANFLAANFYQSAQEATPHELKAIGVSLRYPFLGSNAWAIGPDRAVGGMTMHFSGPQTPFGDAQPECHLEWPGGRVAGYGYGLFVDPGLGLNHAWGSTANWPDTSDVYKLRVKSHPDGGYLYWDARSPNIRGDWVEMTTIPMTIAVKDDTARSVRRWETGLGPVLRIINRPDDLEAYVWRASGKGRIEYIEAMFRKQWASSAREALENADPPEAVSGNWILADRSGDIAFLYNARVFARQSDRASHDILSADNALDEWHKWAWGLKGLGRLPLAVNPACGVVTANNEAPWFATTSGEIEGREAWPAYLVPTEGWGSGPTVRGDRARELLGGNAPISLSNAMALPFDTALPKVKAWIQAWQKACQRSSLRPNFSEDGARLHRILGQWKGRADAQAPGMTAAFFLVRQMQPWADPAEAARSADPPDLKWFDPREYGKAVNGVAGRMLSDYGRLAVPWGEIHGTVVDGRWQPLSGGTDFLPAILQAHGGEQQQGRDVVAVDHRVRCDNGSVHMAFTVFKGQDTRRYSIGVAGQHNPKIHPNSPHCRDQTPYYVSGRFKPFWLAEEDVKTHLTPHEGSEGYAFKAVRTFDFEEGASTATGADEESL
jgi:acyl-homoserine-lactone acylase